MAPCGSSSSPWCSPARPAWSSRSAASKIYPSKLMTPCRWSSARSSSDARAARARHCTAHGEPHDELDRLGAGLLHDFLVAELRQRLRIALELIEKHWSNFSFMKPEALALQLVRHASGAEHYDPAVAGVTLYGGAQRLPQAIAAPCGGQRMLDDIHFQRNGAHRPAIGAVREAEVHRHQEACSDGELLAQREVELVLIDQRLRRCVESSTVAGDFGQRPRAEPSSPMA